MRLDVSIDSNLKGVRMNALLLKAEPSLRDVSDPKTISLQGEWFGDAQRSWQRRAQWVKRDRRAPIRSATRRTSCRSAASRSKAHVRV